MYDTDWRNALELADALVGEIMEGDKREAIFAFTENMLKGGLGHKAAVKIVVSILHKSLDT